MNYKSRYLRGTNIKKLTRIETFAFNPPVRSYVGTVLSGVYYYRSLYAWGEKESPPQACSRGVTRQAKSVQVRGVILYDWAASLA